MSEAELLLAAQEQQRAAVIRHKNIHKILFIGSTRCAAPRAAQDLSFDTYVISQLSEVYLKKL